MTNAELRNAIRKARSVPVVDMTWAYLQARLAEGASYVDVGEELDMSSGYLRSLNHRRRSQRRKKRGEV